MCVHLGPGAATVGSHPLVTLGHSWGLGGGFIFRVTVSVGKWVGAVRALGFWSEESGGRGLF